MFWFVRCCGWSHGSDPSNGASKPDMTAVQLETRQPQRQNQPQQQNPLPQQQNPLPQQQNPLPQQQNPLPQQQNPSPQQTQQSQNQQQPKDQNRNQNYSVQRAFPFMESYLDMWEVRTFLDDRLGVNCYNIRQEADRWILFANHDLGDKDIAELERISGRVESEED